MRVCAVFSNFDHEASFEVLKDQIAQEIFPQKLRVEQPDEFGKFEAATDNVKVRLECQCTSGFYDAEPAVPIKLQELLQSMWDSNPAHRPDSEDVYADIREMAQTELNQRPSSL